MEKRSLAAIRCRDEKLMRRLGAVDTSTGTASQLRCDGLLVMAGATNAVLWWPLVEGADKPLPRSLR